MNSAHSDSHHTHDQNGTAHVHGAAVPDQWNAEQEEKALQRQALFLHRSAAPCTQQYDAALVHEGMARLGTCRQHDPEFHSNDRLSAWRRILCAFWAYELKLGWEVARWRHNYERLPPRHQALLPDEPAKHAAALQCIRANQQVIK